MVLTSAEILALSPDDSSTKAAKGLLAPGKWPLLGFSDAAVWGHCQGSGSKPYQVIIDPAGPAFKCSCPSRKFPCKHGLALFLLRVEKAASFTAGSEPDWVNEWLSSRKDRAEKQAEKKTAQAEGKSVPADPEAAAKREAKRLERMTVGARDLARWLEDLARQGIGDLKSKPASFWRDTSARLVDAQVPGLGQRVRGLEDGLRSGARWDSDTLAGMGRLYLLSEALQRYDELTEPLQADVRSAVGWPLDKDETLAKGERVEDTWLIHAVSYEENERLWERRVWLQGASTGRHALLLDFSHGAKRFEPILTTGTTVKGALIFFPGQAPLRALALDLVAQENGLHAPRASKSWSAALMDVAAFYSGNPWLLRTPVFLESATPTVRNGAWFAIDPALEEAPLEISEDDGWQLLALSGGQPLRIFGEWLEDRWKPLTAWHMGETRPCWMETGGAA